MNKLQLFEIEVPNTCTECGELQHVAVYAENNDMARSGQGKCAVCAGVEPKTSRAGTKRQRGRPQQKKSSE